MQTPPTRRIAATALIGAALASCTPLNTDYRGGEVIHEITFEDSPVWMRWARVDRAGTIVATYYNPTDSAACVDIRGWNPGVRIPARTAARRVAYILPDTADPELITEPVAVGRCFSACLIDKTVCRPL